MSLNYSDDELRFMYENGQGHLTLFCIVFVWLRGRPSTVRSPIQDPWFMYQNRLGPSGGIYYPNFVPCFVYHQLNKKSYDSADLKPAVLYSIKIGEVHRFFGSTCYSKVISVENVAWQNSMRLNLHEKFSRFCRVDRIKTILQNFYIIF